MKRRPKRRADGRWQRKSNGKLFISSISQEDADRKAKEYADAIKAGMRRDMDTMTFRTYAFAWLPRNKKQVTQNTYNDDAVRLEKMMPFFGDCLLKDIRPSMIHDFYNEFLTGKTKASADRVRSLLRGIFDSAMDDGYCRTNPARSKSAKTPDPKPSGSHRALEPWERKAIETTCTDHPLYPLVMLMLYTGLRPSEAMAIVIPRDVDFDRKIVTVREARHLNGIHSYVSSTGKTKLAVGREIPLFSPLAQVLRGKIGRICANKNGQVFSKYEWVNEWHKYRTAMETQLNGHDKSHHHYRADDPIFQQSLALIRAGRNEEAKKVRYADWIKLDIRPYDLRHEFCTWCCTNDVDLHTIVTWMGHANYKMVQNVYDHVTAQRQENEVKKLEFAIKSSQNGSQIV